MAPGVGRLSSDAFPRTLRLRRREEFLRVQRGGKRVHTAHFILILAPRDAERASPARIGITVTTKVANSVGRNRIKRVVREVFRRYRSFFPQGHDVVVIAKSGADQLGYDAVRAEIERVRRALARAAGATE
ncbi:MAG: ribonuclease P protein component [Sandaracinaceae bacterium]